MSMKDVTQIKDPIMWYGLTEELDKLRTGGGGGGGEEGRCKRLIGHTCPPN